MVNAFNHKNNTLRSFLNICRMKTQRMPRQTLKSLLFSVTGSDILKHYIYNKHTLPNIRRIGKLRNHG
jgi:hypothetical protein